MKNNKAIAIIPARGGSKRIPRKNIKDFFGKPLIAYSIHAALDSKLFDKVVVSTDDEEIAKIAKEYGAEVPFIRPKELADDFTGTGTVVEHTLKYLSNQHEHYDYCCTLYATAPLLQAKYLIEGFEKLKISDAINAFSATSMPFPIQRTFKVNPDERCEMFTPEHFMTRSQDLEEAYQDAGQFYWTRLDKKSDEIMFGKDSIPIILPRHLVQDIDTLEDWTRTEYMYQALNKQIVFQNKTSKFKNILFRADSSSVIGIGHIMRDLVLASQLKEQYLHSKIVFATQNLDGNINHKIIESGYEIIDLKTNDQDELIEILKAKSVDMLVVDNYAIDYQYEHYIKEVTCVKILALDDTYEKHDCHILLNHNISADKKRYNNLVPKGCEIRCGSKYTLLRDEFIKERKKKGKVVKTKNKTLFLAMGGADHSNINIKILRVLKKFNNLKIHLVTTSSNRNLKELKKYVMHKKCIKLHVDSTQIAKLMKKSDFAIITPSVTANEAYFMKLPFIAIKTAPNQLNMFNYLKKQRYPILKKFNEKKLKKILGKLLCEI